MTNVNGLLIVNKDKDWTSRDVVNKISHLFDTPRVGHTGTLDPLATGVLVVALGEALKLVDLLVCDTKEYIAEVQTGLLTDSLDILGNVLHQEDYVIDREHLLTVLNSFLGHSIQEVPLYSSVKVNGRRLYEYARANKEVVLPKRDIHIYDIQLLECDATTFRFKVKVSKGTYIRSLIRDIGLRLGTACTMTNLCRIKQGTYQLSESYSLSSIQNGDYQIISLYDVLKDYYLVTVDDFLATKIKNGRILENRYSEDKIVFVDKNKKVLAIYEKYAKDPTKIKPWKVLNS